MTKPAKTAAGDEPARPADDENDYFGTDDYFGRERFFSDQAPATKTKPTKESQ